MTGFSKARAAAAAVMLLCGVDGVSAGPLPVTPTPQGGASPALDVQYYGYGYPPYYRRPYGYYRPYYRPYAYGPRPWLYGPGAAKQRYRTRLDYCLNRPERC